MTFTVGQRVRCIDDTCGNGILKAGETYVVAGPHDIYPEMVCLEGETDAFTGWYPERFVAIDDQRSGPYPGQRMAPIPATAQAILDIGKPTAAGGTGPYVGIARAIDGLQQRDWLLGAARWVP